MITEHNRRSPNTPEDCRRGGRTNEIRDFYYINEEKGSFNLCSTVSQIVMMEMTLGKTVQNNEYYNPPYNPL